MQTFPVDTSARPLPSSLTPAEAKARAWYYRQMAATAATADVRDALIRLAERYEAMAAERIQHEKR